MDLTWGAYTGISTTSCQSQHNSNVTTSRQFVRWNLSGSNWIGCPTAVTRSAPAAELCFSLSRRWTPPLQPCLWTFVSASSCGPCPSSPVAPESWTARVPHLKSTRVTWRRGPRPHIQSKLHRVQRPPRPSAPLRLTGIGLIQDTEEMMNSG